MSSHGSTHQCRIQRIRRAPCSQIRTICSISSRALPRSSPKGKRRRRCAARGSRSQRTLRMPRARALHAYPRPAAPSAPPRAVAGPVATSTHVCAAPQATAHRGAPPPAPLCLVSDHWVPSSYVPISTEVCVLRTTQGPILLDVFPEWSPTELSTH